MRFAKWVFLAAGVSGIILMVPQYFLEEQVSRDYPPRITHPEYFYGFVGVVLSWQVLFLVIGSDPVRFRTTMLPAILEKLSFAVAVPVLYLMQRVSATVVGFAAMDAVWALLFLVAFLRTPKEPPLDGKP